MKHRAVGELLRSAPSVMHAAAKVAHVLVKHLRTRPAVWSVYSAVVDRIFGMFEGVEVAVARGRVVVDQ